MKKILIGAGVVLVASAIIIAPKPEANQVEQTGAAWSEATPLKTEEIIKMNTDTIIEPEVPQEALETAVTQPSAEAEVPFNIMTAVFYANETMDSMTNDVRTVVLSRPHLFTQDNYKKLVDNIRTYLSQYMRHEFEYRFGVYDELNKWASTEPLN